MTRPGKYTPHAVDYEDTPEQVKHREERNASRLAAAREGKKVKGKDVAHIKPLAGGGSNLRANERVESVARNRGWRRGQHGYKVPEDK